MIAMEERARRMVELVDCAQQIDRELREDFGIYVVNPLLLPLRDRRIPREVIDLYRARVAIAVLAGREFRRAGELGRIPDMGAPS